MKRKLFMMMVFLLMFVVIGSVTANKALILTEYTIASDKLPSVFNGFRIAHISDLHNESFGKNNEKLVAMVQKSEPDIIVITGDLIDSRNTDIDVSVDFVRQIKDIAPVYYVNGNHEARIDEYTLLKIELNKLGVIVLENGSSVISKEGECINILGVNDPAFDTGGGFFDCVESEAKMLSSIHSLKNNCSEYTILLSHRPEYFEVYIQSGVDLVFSGHAHGGQFRLPFIGGLVAPGQGLFPEYDSGVFTEDDTSMIVSRGLGNSIIPLRVNNRPEVIIVELKCK